MFSFQPFSESAALRGFCCLFFSPFLFCYENRYSTHEISANYAPPRPPPDSLVIPLSLVELPTLIRHAYALLIKPASLEKEIEHLEKEIEQLRETSALQTQRLEEAVAKAERASEDAVAAAERASEDAVAAAERAEAVRREEADTCRREMESALAEVFIVKRDCPLCVERKCLNRTGGFLRYIFFACCCC